MMEVISKTKTEYVILPTNEGKSEEKKKLNNWKESLINYFKRGEKESLSKNLGIEVEHFVLFKEDMTAVPYAGDKGIKEVISELMKKYPEAEEINEGSLLGFNVPEFSITLEPAAQVEISIAPCESVKWVGESYKEFLKNFSEVLDKFGYIAKNTGTQPVNNVEDLTLIPKRRYELMNAHFKDVGTGGMQMMRGSASLQVSIDYRSEEDFKNKFQAAYYYGPILKILCDNSESFQGEKVKGSLKRTDIWRRTDSNRCGIIPNVFAKDFGYATYADFIGNLIPIFIKNGEEILPTGKDNVASLYDGKSLNEDEIAHVLSMAFPDVRLKQFIEIRFADSVESPYIEAYSALIKGLLYSNEGIGFAQNEINSFKEEDIIHAEDELMEKGWNANVYGRNIKEFAKDILDMAKRNLPDEEKSYIDPFYSVIENGGIVNLAKK